MVSTRVVPDPLETVPLAYTNGLCPGTLVPFPSVSLTSHGLSPVAPPTHSAMTDSCTKRMRGRLQLLAGTTGSNRGPQKIRKIDNCFPPRKEPLTAVENGQPMGWLTETGLLGDLKIGRRRDVVCQGMRILVRLIDEWWGGIKIISACYKGWISNSSGLNDDMGPVRLCVIPSVRRFVNRSVKGQGRSTKLTRA